MVLGGLGVGHVGTGPTCAHSNEAPNALYLRSLCILSCCWDYIYMYIYIYLPRHTLTIVAFPSFKRVNSKRKGCISKASRFQMQLPCAFIRSQRSKDRRKKGYARGKKVTVLPTSTNFVPSHSCALRST